MAKSGKTVVVVVVVVVGVAVAVAVAVAVGVGVAVVAVVAVVAASTDHLQFLQRFGRLCCAGIHTVDSSFQFDFQFAKIIFGTPGS